MLNLTPPEERLGPFTALSAPTRRFCVTVLTLAPRLHVLDAWEGCVLTPPCRETSFQQLIDSDRVNDLSYFSERPFILTTCPRTAGNMLIYYIEKSGLHLYDLASAKIRGNTFITVTIWFIAN